VEQIFHVFKKLHVPTLVAGDGDALYIFFNGTFHDLGHTAVMPQVNDLGALALQNAAHDIDGCIVPIEQGGCRYDPYFMFRCKTHGVVIVFWYQAAVQVPASLASHTCTEAILSTGIVNR
jgi:hypothetical protein